jgi:predicted ABC-type ATPase
MTSACRPGDPALWLIAGPEGVGRTTYAVRHIREVAGSVHFVNLDEIARGLSPLAPGVARGDAARVALDRARQFIAERTAFSMETTLSGAAQLRLAERALAAGMAFHLLYFAVATPEVCIRRVARRVAEGGHAVPEPDIRRRFARSLERFPAYANRATTWRVLDNSGLAPAVVADAGPWGVDLAEDRLAALPPGLAAAVGALASAS